MWNPSLCLQCAGFSYLSSYYTFALNVNLLWISATAACLNYKTMSWKMWMFVLDCTLLLIWVRILLISLISIKIWRKKHQVMADKKKPMRQLFDKPLIKSNKIWKNAHYWVANWAFQKVFQGFEIKLWLNMLLARLNSINLHPTCIQQKRRLCSINISLYLVFALNTLSSLAQHCLEFIWSCLNLELKAE